MKLPETVFSTINKPSIHSHRSDLEVNSKVKQLEDEDLSQLKLYQSFLILFGYILVIKGYLIEFILKFLENEIQL